MTLAQLTKARENRERYALLVDAGLCVQCKAERGRPGAYCAKCTRRKVSPNARAARVAWRARQLRKGLCENCGKRPRAENWQGRKIEMCDACAVPRRKRRRDLWSARYPRQKTMRCGLCNGAGHNRLTCKGKPWTDTLRIEDIATARKGWD